MTPDERASAIWNTLNHNDDAGNIYFIAREIERAAVDSSRWIPVTESKPAHGNNVSILFHNGNRYSACYVAGAWYWNDGQWLDSTLIAAWCEMPFVPKAKV